MKKVLVIGSINVDLVIKVDKFPLPGETLKGSSFIQHPGGKGANQASAAIKQNILTTLWGKIGLDSYGIEMSNYITNLGINPFLQTVDTSTGTAFIEISKEGQNRIIIIGGANDQFTTQDIDTNISLIDDHDIIVLQFEIPLDVCTKVINEAHKKNKIIICNPAPAFPIDSALFPKINYLIPNEHELSIISSLPTENNEQIEQAMLSLKEKGVGTVITTLGNKGFCYTNNNKIHYQLPHNVSVVDTTGAGDSFVGSFAAYLAKEYSLEKALNHANTAASISVTRFGAFASAGSEEEVHHLINTQK